MLKFLCRTFGISMRELINLIAECAGVSVDTAQNWIEGNGLQALCNRIAAAINFLEGEAIKQINHEYFNNEAAGNLWSFCIRDLLNFLNQLFDDNNEIDQANYDRIKKSSEKICDLYTNYLKNRDDIIVAKCRLQSNQKLSVLR